MPHKPTLIERIRAKVVINGETGCWNFSGALRNGYGVIGVGGPIVNKQGGRTAPIDYVHRITYAATHGPILEGLHIDHLCRNRRCCNPSHLEPVTQAENNLRMKRDNARDACKRGHKYVPGSYRMTPRQRVCRVCIRERYAEQKADSR